MKIGISLLTAGPQRTGVENAALNLITELSAINDQDEYLVYANRHSQPWLSGLPDRVRVVNVKLSSRRARWLWEHLFFRTGSRPTDLDLVHFPIGGGVVGYRGTFVLTIHDLNHYSNRDLTKLRRHLLWRAWYKANVKRAARIITVSEHVKNDILREFPGAAGKIRVIPNGVDRRFQPGAVSQAFRAQYQLPERYVLFVGATAANKNIKRAIDAVKLARSKYGIDHQFIVAGMPGEEDVRLKKYVNNNSLHDIVRFIGYVPNDDLPQLYANAELFLFPSIMEGFGIPPVEAMRCGIPVVAASTSCMPEILGDAAIWVDPLSADSIADGLGKVLLNPDIRTKTIEKGLSRAAQFSWEKMAADTANVYREVLDNPMKHLGAVNFRDGATDANHIVRDAAFRRSTISRHAVRNHFTNSRLKEERLEGR